MSDRQVSAEEYLRTSPYTRNFLIDVRPIPVARDLGFPHDHGQITWDHLLAQHMSKRNTENFIKPFYEPLNILDRVLETLYIDRSIMRAQGDALDKIGSIVGMSRDIPNVIYMAYFGFASQPSGRAFGEARMRKEGEAWTETARLPDEEYRIAITTKIFLNNGHGTAEEIVFAIERTLRLTLTGKVHIQDRGNANADLYIPELIQSSDPRFYLIDQLIPRAAGVKIWITYTHGIYIFGFEGKGNFYGFDVGVLSRTTGTP